MATVSGQVRARKPAAKPATATKPAARAAKPATKPAATATKPTRSAKPKPAATGNASKDVERAAKMTLEELLEIPTDKRNDAQKARIKELKKARAFEKLRERAQEKKEQRAADRVTEMGAITEEHPVGAIRYLTRASYYGCRVEVLAFDEVRGRNLITVKVLTTKGGEDLEEDDTYERRVSAKFLQEEKPTDKYKRGSRRPSEAHAEDEAEEAPEDEAELEDAEEAEDEDVAEDEEELEDEEDDSEYDDDVAEDEDDSWVDEDEEE